MAGPHDDLVLLEQWTLTDQVDVGRIGLHCYRTNCWARFILGRSLDPEQSSERGSEGLVRTLNPGGMITCPSGISNQRGTRDPAEHEPCGWHDHGAGCQVQAVATGHEAPKASGEAVATNLISKWHKG